MLCYFHRNVDPKFHEEIAEIVKIVSSEHPNIRYVRDFFSCFLAFSGC